MNGCCYHSIDAEAKELGCALLLPELMENMNHVA